MSQEIQLNQNLVGNKFMEMQSSIDSMIITISGELADEVILQTTNKYNELVNDYSSLLDKYKTLFKDNLQVTEASVETFVAAEEQLALHMEGPTPIR